jgi:hypothetical protein
VHRSRSESVISRGTGRGPLESGKAGRIADFCKAQYQQLYEAGEKLSEATDWIASVVDTGAGGKHFVS